MRTAVRHLILQRCFALPTPARGPQPWQCIAYNISTIGIGIALPIQLPQGTVLTIEAWNLRGAVPLQARIIHTKPVEFLWFTGCELLKPLSERELQLWCSGPIDWVDHPEPQAALPARHEKRK
jgi:hypothetical protein